MISRLARWAWRYLPAEAAGLVAALVSAHVAWLLSNANPAIAALTGASAETGVHYATMLLRDIRERHVSLPIILRDLVLEFGAAEALDSLLLRPALMDVATRLTSDVIIGITLGKLGGDVVFLRPDYYLV
jgi:hypothetical protein